MTAVRTVLGDVDPAEIGVTACHEHLVIDSPVVAARFPHIHLDSVDEAVAELEPWERAGLGSVVDTMPVAQGGDASRLAEISRRTGVHIVASTGLHTAKYDLESPPNDIGELADRFVADLTATEHPCGIIKVSTGPDGVDHRARLLFAAAAEASARTGAPIVTHCEDGTGGVDQVTLLLALGVPATRVALSHTDKVADLGYHGELLSSGVSLAYDQGLRRPDATVRLVAALVTAGHAAQLMLGTDGARRTLWSTHGGKPGLAWLLTGLVPELERAGVDRATLDAILVDNPARWLAIDA